jgi:hypothetical protein
MPAFGSRKIPLKLIEYRENFGFQLPLKMTTTPFASQGIIGLTKYPQKAV